MTGIRISSPQFNVAPGSEPDCKFVNDPGNYWTGFYITGGALGMSSAPTITVVVPAGLVTAPLTARTDTWIVGPYSLNWNSGTQVEVTSRAISVANSSAATSTFAPQPPTNVRLVREFDPNIGFDVLRVTWDAPSDPGTLPVTHYAVYGGTNWGAPEQARVAAGCLNDSTAKDFTSCVVSSPSYGYEPVPGPNMFFVKAFNGLGWSGASPASNMVDIRAMVRASAPTNVKVVPGRNKLIASWGPPTSVGSSPVVAYIAVAKPGYKVCITRTQGVAADANPFTCAIDMPGTNSKYTVTLEASNRSIAGEQSAPSAPVSPWDIKVDGYSRDKVLLGLRQEVTLKGKAPGLPVGTPVTAQWQIFSKDNKNPVVDPNKWQSAGTTKVTSSNAMSFTKMIPFTTNQKATVAMRFVVLDPVTKQAEATNQVVITGK